MMRELEHVNCPCSGVIAAEMEGIKLDMSILEGRFANAIKENKSKTIEGTGRYNSTSR